MNIGELDHDVLETITSMISDKFALVEAGVDVPNADDTKAMIEIRRICFDDQIKLLEKRIRHKRDAEIPMMQEMVDEINKRIQIIDEDGQYFTGTSVSAVEFRGPVNLLKDREFVVLLAKSECSTLRRAIKMAQYELEQLREEHRQRVVTRAAMQATEQTGAMR